MRKNNKEKTLVLFLYLFILIFYSFDINSKPLNEIFDISLKAATSEPNVISGRIEVQSAEADLSASKRTRLPVFNAAIVNGLIIDRNIRDNFSQRKREDEGLDLRLQMVQPIFTGFKIQSDINRNKAIVSGSVLEANNRFSQTIIECISAYIDYHYAISLKNSVENNLNKSKRIVDLEKKRYDAGLTDLSVYSQIRVKLSEIQLLYNMVQNELLGYEAAFRRFFPDENIKSSTNTSYKDYDFDLININAASYELEKAKFELEAAKADLLKSRGDRLPSVALTVTGTLFDVDGSDYEDEEYDIQGGLQASWQFLDFGVNRKKVSSKRSRVNSIKYRIDYQRRIDEVQKLSLLSNIAAINKQLNEQYEIRNDLDNQSKIMDAQLTSSKFIGLSLIDLLYQRDQIQRNINSLESQHVEANLRLKLLTQSLQDFVVSRSVN